jgi:hypothetical protein
MNKICTNPKNYKLTQGKVYEILDEEDGYYLLINDSNKTVRYYSDLFEDVETTETVTPPPPPPVRTEADVISSLSVVRNNYRCHVTYVDLNNQNVNFDTASINAIDINISCGIKQMYNINGILETIDENISADDDDLLELKKEIFKRTISLFINMYRTAARWILMSTNYDDHFEDYYDVLNELSEETSLEWSENPNSGNEIKLWVFNTENF